MAGLFSHIAFVVVSTIVRQDSHFACLAILLIQLLGVNRCNGRFFGQVAQLCSSHPCGYVSAALGVHIVAPQATFTSHVSPAAGGFQSF
jgi:hypothetical protein